MHPAEMKKVPKFGPNYGLKYGKVAEKEPKGCTEPERGTVLTGLKPRVKLRSSDSREKALPGDRAANPDLR